MDSPLDSVRRRLDYPGSLTKCVACGLEDATPVLNVPKIPLHHFIPGDWVRSAAAFGVMDVVACNGCGHLYNRAFDEARTESLYAGHAQSNIPVSQGMLQALESTAAVILRHALPSSSVLEVGGGAGHLSRILAQKTQEVHLVEPSLAVAPEAFPEANIVFHRTMFPTPALAGKRFDVLVCRQVLEHVPDPAPFLLALREALREQGVAYVEIPSAEYIVANHSIVDFHYAHVHYYRRDTVESLFADAGFAVLDRVDVKQGHDVGFVLKPAKRATLSAPTAGDLIGTRKALQERRAIGSGRLSALRGEVALYGANSYSQSLLGLYPDARTYRCVFDDTPQYAGHHAYGPAQDLLIGPPKPELLAVTAAVIVTAYLHDSAITRRLRSMGYEGPVYTVRADATAGRGHVPPSLFHPAVDAR